MKKYGKLLSMFIVIVLSIGSFYIHKMWVIASYPEFKLTTVEGDPQLADNVSLGAFYYSAHDNSVLRITDQGSAYRDQQSFFGQMKGIPYSYDRKLRDEFGHAMRGMNYGATLVYEDDQHLVLVSLQTIGYNNPIRDIEIRYLNKDSAKTVKTITHRLNNANHLSVHDVQLNGEQIIVFAYGWKKENNEEHVTLFAETYTFDMEKSTFVEHETILTDSRENVNLNYLYESVHWRSKPYIVYRLKEDGNEASGPEMTNIMLAQPDEPDASEEEATGDEPINELYAYHVESGTLERIHLPPTLQAVNVDLYDGSNLFFVDHLEGGTRVTIYSIGEKKTVSELMIPLKPGASDERYMIVDRELLYVLDMKDGDAGLATLSIFQAGTGEKIYRGEIVPTDRVSDENSFYLDVYGIDILH